MISRQDFECGTKLNQRLSTINHDTQLLEDLSSAFEQKFRCAYDADPPCVTVCPLNLPILQILDLLKKSNFDRAKILFEDTSILPNTVAGLCQAYCQRVCLRINLDEAVMVNEVERYLAGGIDECERATTYIPLRDQSIFFMDSSIAALSFAAVLQKKGYRVSFYESKEMCIDACINNADIAENENAGRLICRDIARISKGDRIRFSESNIKFNNVTIRLAKNQPKFRTPPSNSPNSSTLELFGGKAVFKNDDDRLDIILQLPPEPVFQVVFGRDLAFVVDQYLKHGNLVQKQLKTQVDCLYRIDAQEKIQYSELTNGKPDPEEIVKEAERCLYCQCRECIEECTLMRSGKMGPPQYITEAAQSLKTQRRLHDKLNVRRISGCNLCGLCKEKCPSDIDMGEVYYQSRRIMQSTGEMPEAFYDFWIRDLLENEQNAFSWPPMHTKQVEYLFFPGCQLGGSNPFYVEKTYQYLCSQFGENLAIDMHCCGAEAIWAGRDDLVEVIHERFMEYWRSIGSPIVITTCSTCRKYLAGSIGQDRTCSLWEVLDQDHYIGYPPVDDQKHIALYDPCASRYFPGEQEAVRTLLVRNGYQFQELPNNKDKAQCCGFGGLIYPANREIFNSVVSERIHLSALPYMTYCSNCLDLFNWNGKNSSHILDIFIDKNSSLEFVSVSNYSQKRANKRAARNQIRKMLMNNPSGLESEPYPEIVIQLNEAVEQKMSLQLILDCDLKKIIYEAECSGNKFRINDRYVAHAPIGAITIWVEYRPSADGIFEVVNVYSHRMKISEDT